MKKLFKIYGPEWMGYFERRTPYPLRAAKLSIAFTLFPWWKPSFHYNKKLTEAAKRDGATIWKFSWLWVQISFGRWV
jgi:hypothetical protein